MSRTPKGEGSESQASLSNPHSQKHMREEFAKRLKGKHNAMRQSPVLLKRGLEMVGIG